MLVRKLLGDGHLSHRLLLMVSVIQADAENFVRIRDGWTQPESLRLQAEFGRKCIPRACKLGAWVRDHRADRMPISPKQEPLSESLRINNQRVYKDAGFPVHHPRRNSRVSNEPTSICLVVSGRHLPRIVALARRSVNRKRPEWKLARADACRFPSKRACTGTLNALPSDSVSRPAIKPGYAEQVAAGTAYRGAVRSDRGPVRAGGLEA